MNTKPLPEFSIAGVDAVLMTFGNSMSANLPVYLAHIRQSILQQLDGIVAEVVPAYTSLLVYYDARTVRLYDLELALEKAAAGVAYPAVATAEQIVLNVPVCYGGHFGPDLERVAEQSGLTTTEVIQLHQQANYLVAALGFAPGFAYLSGLHEKLITPRLDTPRKKVPAGSLGIAGVQTAVYPTSGPGGWNLIGRAVMTWFNAKGNPAMAHGPEAMTPVQVGDRIRFVAISEADYLALYAASQGEHS